MAVDAITSNKVDTQNLKEVRSDVDVVIKFFNEDINAEEHSTVISTRNIYSGSSDSFIIGHTSNGVLGVANGVGGNQIKLGDSRSAAVVLRVVNPNNVWQETIRATTFKDTGNTTATWDLTNFRWTFTGSQIIQTLSIFLNSTTITNARLDIATGNITTVGNLTFQLSADGGSNWETVTLNTTHTFTNTGTDLRLKISSSGNAVIDIDDSDDVSTTIKIYYNE